VESHAPHLPLDTDLFLAESLLDAAAPLLPETVEILRLPALWLGASGEHAHARGTLSREPEALIADIEAIGEGLAHMGVKKLLLFDAHGGNVPAANIAALKLRRRFDMLAAHAHWLDFGLPEGFRPPSPPKEDIHGGWLETSLMLHFAPERVRQDLIAPCDPRPPAAMLFPKGPIAWGWRTDDLMGTDAAKGNWLGRPDLATAEIGHTLATHAAQNLARLLTQLAEVGSFY
jgi:creatinine amidohydrolase